MDGGATRKRRVTPPMEKPMSCVDITRSHASDVVHMSTNDEEEEGKKHATEAE